MTALKYLLTAFLVGAVSSSVGAHRAALRNNGYYDIVVAISPDASKTKAQTIVDNIKLLFREASPVLYRATLSRAYFRNVTILLPDAWTEIAAQSSTWETYNDAEVRITPANLAYGDTPYTLQTKGCGQPGEYIHFTPEYISTLNTSANTARYGPSGKVLVHEWAHLRYGVFDEYGVPGDRAFPLFYRPSLQSVVGTSNEIVPNICSNTRANFFTENVNGGGCNIDPETGLYEKDCRYIFSEAFKPKTSMMSDHSISTITDFCDDGEINIHNIEAPNKHNAMCSSQSVWKIITQHPDFVNNNPPNDISNVQPSFTVVRQSMESTRFVLVADVSGSMLDYNRIRRLNQSARRWIKYDVPNGSKLGLIQFSNTATVLAPLTVVNDVTRPQLMAKVPSSTLSATCIGCGLAAAIQMLRPTGNGGVIILLTDGENSPGFSDIGDALPGLIAAGIRVVTIAFGTSADKDIENLAEATDGKSYFVSDDDTTQGLNQAFIGSLTYQPAVSAQNLVVKLFQGQYKQAGLINEKFSADFTVGKNLVFQVDYTQKTNLKSAKLVAPDGTEYTNLVYDDDASAAFIKLDMASTGVWNFFLDISNNKDDTFFVSVRAQTKDNSTAPIYTTCKVANGGNIPDVSITPVIILAEVKQGNNAVLGARVQAYIEKPNLQLEILDLFDNGAVADVTKHDGIYSRYFITATSTGRYSIQCQVRDEGSAFINDGFIASSILVHDEAPYCCGSEVPIGDGPKAYTGNFTRSEAGGGFKVDKAVSNTNPYPPGRVIDLAVVNMTKDGLMVTLQWTAPGDDLDFGTVSNYTVKYSTNARDLLENAFNTAVNATQIMSVDIVGGSLIPLEAGQIQQVTISLVNATTGSDVTYFFALRAIDKGRKESLVSNVAAVSIVDIPDEPGFNGGAIAGIVIACIVAVALITGTVLYFLKKK